MPIQGDRYAFTEETIDRSPDQHGVYQLEDGASIIYIGRAAGTGVTIRSRLRDHKGGRDGPCTKGASHFRREVTEAAVSREKELLEEYKRNNNGRLPRCNDRST